MLNLYTCWFYNIFLQIYNLWIIDIKLLIINYYWIVCIITNISEYYIITSFSSQNNQAVWLLTVEVLAGECICFPTPDVFSRCHSYGWRRW